MRNASYIKTLFVFPFQSDALARKAQEEEDTRQSRETSIKHCDRQWASASERVLMQKEAKLAEKRHENMLRKKSAVKFERSAQY